MNSSRRAFDARARIEQRKKAKEVQAKVDAIRRTRIRRGPGFTNGNNGGASSWRNSNADLSNKLVRSRKRVSDQQPQRQKTFPNFTVVATVEPRKPTIVRKTVQERTRRLPNLTRTIVNNNAGVGLAAATKRRSDPIPTISPLKRLRHVSSIDDDAMAVDGDLGTRSTRPVGAAGMFLSALQRAQSQDHNVPTSLSVTRRPPGTIHRPPVIRRPTGTMVADSVESKTAVRQNLQRRLQERLASSVDQSKPVVPKFVDGYRVLISNLNEMVTSEDVMELFGAVGQLRDAYLMEPGLGEAIFIRRTDAEAAVKEFHNRELDGIPMHCKLLTTKISSNEKPSKISNATLNSRFRSDEKAVSLPITKAPKTGSAPVPERELVQSILFSNRGGSSAKSDVTFTVKV